MRRHERRGHAEQRRAQAIDHRRAGHVDEAAQRRAGDDGALQPGRAEGHGARQQRGRHQQRHQRLLRRHLEGAHRAQHHRQRQQQRALRQRRRRARRPAPAPPAPAAATHSATMRARWWRSTTWPATSTSASAGRNCSSPTSPRSQAEPVRSYICQPMATSSIWLALTPASRAHHRRMKSRQARSSRVDMAAIIAWAAGRNAPDLDETQ